MCLVVAVVLNAFVLLINLHLSTLEDELASKRSQEGYYMTNRQAITSEMTKRTQLHTELNQLKMLRRLTRHRLTPQENEALVQDEKVLQRKISASLRKAAIGTYLQANDPPPGKDPNKMFSNMTDEEVLAVSFQLEEQAWQYAQNLKTEMVRLMGEVSLWKRFHSLGLILSTIILVVGNFLIFATWVSADYRS